MASNTLTQEVKDRKLALKQLLGALKSVDTAIERTERELRRINNRKRSIPTKLDLERIADLANGLEASTTEFAQKLAATEAIFEAM